ncbi:MAG: helix-turn-helix domain-containing protein [Patescibacteria group bacterium]|nr:helix-turn-helix domain-containing protein [Patescibacteria group bacterium]MBU1015923.1 helix-turn-helix domain-containing protein [Patescibacteria group bacterium]MBU1685092.1 helix-turn-helix domain-containing protein [Patescibacteria group bacterium]MBU1938145.1 helix-turn-helix domain-containing protein [Patescibacteria group bacterium]
MPVVDRLYTTEQVAKLLQIHPLTVLKYINSGKLRAVKLGRVYRVTETSLQKFLDEMT